MNQATCPAVILPPYNLAESQQLYFINNVMIGFEKFMTLPKLLFFYVHSLNPSYLFDETWFINDLSVIWAVSNHQKIRMTAHLQGR